MYDSIVQDSENDLIELRRQYIDQLILYAKDYTNICVDLDGTLIMEESAVDFLKKSWRKPKILLNIIKHFCRSMLHAGAYIATQIHNWTLRNWLIEALIELKTQHNKNIFLATGSHYLLAQRVVNSVLFDDNNNTQQLFEHIIISSTESYYCVKLNKLRKMQEHFNDDFFYIGNSSQDICIFQHTKNGCIITNSTKIIKQIPNTVLILPNMD